MSERLVDQNYPDTFVCELSKVERIGANRRLIFTVPSIEGDGFRMVVAKLIVPADYMVTLAYTIAGDGTKPAVADELFSAMEPIGKAN
jgi:hypothetical protein